MTAMNLEKAKAEIKKSATDVYAGALKPFFWFLVITIGGLCLIWFVIYQFAPTAKQIEWDYRIDSQHITVASQPHDCEFLTAPVGSKNCHYERQVTLFDARGQIIGGDIVGEDGRHEKTAPTEQVIDARIDWIKIKE